MSDFDQSQWADPAFARGYLDHADHYLPDRQYLFHVLRSFFRFYIARPEPVRLCDLGCGDGILTDQLLREAPTLEATLVDGSVEMLDAAKRRFTARPDVRYVQQGFDGVIRDSSALGSFHFIVSSFAIHHLHREPRRALFATALRHLEPGGWFMNMDVALPDHATFTEWQYQLWQEWIDQRSQRLGLAGQFHDVPRQARANPDNKYSPLAEQLADLTAAGFANVECHYKNGIFAIYAGQRPAV